MNRFSHFLLFLPLSIGLLTSCGTNVYVYGNASDLDDGTYIPKVQANDSAYYTVSAAFNSSTTGWQPADKDRNWGMISLTAADRGNYFYAASALHLGAGQYNIDVPDYQANDLNYGFITLQGEVGGHLRLFNDRLEWRYLQLGAHASQEMGAYRGTVRRMRAEGVNDTNFAIIDLNPTGFNLKINVSTEIQFNLNKDFRVGAQLGISGFYTGSAYFTTFLEYKRYGGYVRFRNPMENSDVDILASGPMFGVYYRF